MPFEDFLQARFSEKEIKKIKKKTENSDRKITYIREVMQDGDSFYRAFYVAYIDCLIILGPEKLDSFIKL
jgi:hypothetical protein